MRIVIYTDGAARGNPGRSASGYFIFDADHRLLFKEALYDGIKTNNFAEYYAVISALEKVAELYGYDNEIELFSDSKLVVNQLNGLYKTKTDHIKALNSQAMTLSKRFKRCAFSNVPRENEYISMVDKALNNLLDRISIKWSSQNGKFQKRIG
jgi:ribonuclease HI